MIFGSDSSIGGGGEGSRGGIGRDKPIGLEPEPSDSKEGDEDEVKEDMANQNMEWMTQGPLVLLGDLHKMMKQSERMITNFDLENTMKAEDHLDNFYLQL